MWIGLSYMIFINMYDKWYIVVIYTVYAVWYLVHYIYMYMSM